MATPLAAERLYLRVVREDDRAIAIRELDERIDTGRGEMHEYPDATGRGPTLFRYTGFDGVQSAHTIPLDRLTPQVRAKLNELVVLIEDAARF